MHSSMKTFLALLAVVSFCGCKPSADAELARLMRAAEAESRLEEMRELARRAEEARMDAALDRFVAESNRRDEEFIAARVTEQNARTAQVVRTAEPLPAPRQPVRLHRRFSSAAAEEAYIAGRLPEYQAAMEARAMQQELLDEQRRTTEAIERLRGR